MQTKTPGTAPLALPSAFRPPAAPEPSGAPAGGGKAGVLDAIRAGTVKGVVPGARDARTSLLVNSVSGTRRPRLVFAIDATASRQPAWEAAVATTDALFAGLPGEVDVAMAVHGGGRLGVFTEFYPDANALRDLAAGIGCSPGRTRMLDVLAEARKHPGVRAVIYVGDCFEEDEEQAMAAADAMRVHGTKLIVLHDGSAGGAGVAAAAELFQAMAKRTGGCVLPFDPAARGHLRDLLSAVAVFSAGGQKMLAERAHSLPAARLLLARLKE